MNNKNIRGIYAVSNLLLQYWRCSFVTSNRCLQTGKICRKEGSSGGSVRDQLLCKIAAPSTEPKNKVSVVGVGQVGLACVGAILMKKITNNMAMMDMNEKHLKGELMDLRHSSVYLDDAIICGDKDASVTANSKIIVITAGARQQKDESRLNLVKKNVDIYKCLVPELVKHSPNCILLIITNPVDVMTHVAWKVSGLPCNRVVGSGTSLDTSRFRYFIGDRLHVRPKNVRAWVIGEHGDSSVPVWSGANVGTVRLRKINPAVGTKDDKEKWSEVHAKVVNSAMDVIKLKGYTSWAIGLTVASLVRAMLRNSGEIKAVSIFAKGYHCIDKDVHLSLPCVLGRHGVSHVLRLPLTEEETCRLGKSADIIHEVLCGVKL